MLSFFPRDVLDEIWDLIGSVSEGFFYLLFHITKISAKMRVFMDLISEIYRIKLHKDNSDAIEDFSLDYFDNVSSPEGETVA